MPPEPAAHRISRGADFRRSTRPNLHLVYWRQHSGPIIRGRPLAGRCRHGRSAAGSGGVRLQEDDAGRLSRGGGRPRQRGEACRTTPKPGRSEEHTSELQSLMRISYAVFCLKKKKNKKAI